LGLLAEFANAIQRVGDALDQAIDEVVSAVIDQRSSGNRQAISHLVVKLAAQALAAGLKQIVSRLSLVGHIDQLQRALRILAILMCPAPEQHRAVIEYCIDPLERPISTQIIRQRLEASMPQWMTVSPIEQPAAAL
jgi:hypothetical protein